MNKVWQEMLLHVMQKGRESAPRNMKIVESLNHTIQINMKKPILTIRNRKMGYRFMIAEAIWILQGDNKVDTIKSYSKEISRFSDDGITFFGAYGPKFVDQSAYICSCLLNDDVSRQAVLNIWRENPMPTKDVPCTLNIQFFIRENTMNTVVNMRSSDCWLGVPYDVFNFTMMTASIMLRLRSLGMRDLQIGTLYMNAGSRHIYERNWEDAVKCIDNNSVDFQYDDFDPYNFDNETQLIKYLINLRDDDYSATKWIAQQLRNYWRMSKLNEGTSFSTTGQKIHAKAIKKEMKKINDEFSIKTN